MSSNYTVANFTTTNVSDTPSNYIATITWGDGSSTTTGTIAESSVEAFSVRGSHTYTKAGTFDVTVVVKPTAGGRSISTSSGYATVVAAPLTAVAAAVKATHAVAFTGVVGSFSDPNASAGSSPLFAISINWGDGTTSVGTASYNSSTKQWNVTGTHKYASAGTYKTGIHVTDKTNGVSTTITSTISVA